MAQETQLQPMHRILSVFDGSYITDGFLLKTVDGAASVRLRTEEGKTVWIHLFKKREPIGIEWDASVSGLEDL